jgi:hypothetical protein
LLYGYPNRLTHQTMRRPRRHSHCMVSRKPKLSNIVNLFLAIGQDGRSQGDEPLIEPRDDVDVRSRSTGEERKIRNHKREGVPV